MTDAKFPHAFHNRGVPILGGLLRPPVLGEGKRILPGRAVQDPPLVVREEELYG